MEQTIFAPIDGTLIKRAAFTPKDRAYQMCVRCVMDTTDPEITFDEHGFCSHCRYFDNEIVAAWPSPEEGRRQLNAMVAKVKEYGRGRDYDCIIGISGGIDSSYCAVKMAEWGLRPLVVHVDAGWNSEEAVKNIEQICTRLNFDLITHVVDWDEMKDLQVAFLKSHVANQDIPQDHAFFAALYGYATKAGIKYVVTGSNYATESILPSAWGYDSNDLTHLKGIHDRFGTRKLKTFPMLGFWDLHLRHPRILKMEVLKPLNCIPYSKERAIDELQSGYGWRYYGGKHFESRWTRFFQAYYLPFKFGYDKRKAHLSSLVVAGSLSRDEALKELAKPLYDPKLLEADKQFISKKLGLQPGELDELIAAPPRRWQDYPTHHYKIEWLLRATRLKHLLFGRKRRS